MFGVQFPAGSKLDLFIDVLELHIFHKVLKLKSIYLISWSMFALNLIANITYAGVRSPAMAKQELLIDSLESHSWNLADFS